MTDNMSCSLCGTQLQLSTLQSVEKIRCVNKKCSAYYIQINKDEHESGVMDNFIKFWDCYPKKVSKKDAIKAWIDINPTKELSSDIVVAVVAHTFSSEQWIEKIYIPHPATFLRGRMWEDEVVSKCVVIHPLDDVPIREAPVKSTSSDNVKETVKKAIRLTKQMMVSKNKKERDRLREEIKVLTDEARDERQN
jgi:hypothetical protein|tara:strand:+ start:875 stop:1453 length:579 start_codon:yes stop_codon:yes gene_type:complete